MRLWSLHPAHLDARGLVALWREGLLARAVLRGETRGYRHHPQLKRFRDGGSPRGHITTYLHMVADEADRRGYRFDRKKLVGSRATGHLRVTRGQLEYEWEHLRRKLKARSPADYQRALLVRRPRAHPLFRVVPGGVADWERD